MVLSEYYNILGLPVNSSIEEIKKAYRKKARLYHPDINHQTDAKDKFIRITEAYDFLICYHENRELYDKEYFRIIEDWRKYRQDRSRQRAHYYAQSSYARFKNTQYYKSTRIFNAAPVIFNFVIALLVLANTIFGFILKLKNPEPGEENRTLFSFILLLTLSVILLSVSFLYLKSYIAANKKHKKKKDPVT